MNYRRGILLGALLWVLIFFEVSILMFGFGMTAPMASWIHQVLLILLVLICSWIYFNKTRKIKMAAMEGLYLGLIFVITGMVLDAVITVPLFVKSYGFFADPLLWLGYAEMVVLTVIYSALRK